MSFISSRIAERIAAHRLVELLEILSELSVRNEQLVHTDKAPMIWMLTAMARPLLSTEDSIPMPYSVNSWGAYVRCCPRPGFRLTIWDRKEATIRA
jgi:hypothetical protein